MWFNYFYFLTQIKFIFKEYIYIKIINLDINGLKFRLNDKINCQNNT